MIKIGIDINEANVTNRVGTGQYCYNILKRWYGLKNLDFQLYHRDLLQADLFPSRIRDSSGGTWQYHQVKPSRGWIRFALPLKLATSAKNDVFWSPAHYMPSLTRCPSVVTIHDLAYEFFPDLFLPSDLYKLKNWSRKAVVQSQHVIAVSQATKDDLIKIYDVPEEKISVVHNGYDSDLFNLKHPSRSAILTNFKLEKNNYLLFLGTIQPRKNAIKLIQAFHLLKQQGYPGKLVLAGGIGWLADDTLKVIKESPEHKDIVLTGYINDEARKALYEHCDVYVLPSLYEGFGVPALEAMGCGAPVAVSNNSSLPEVVGDAGMIFNPSDPADIAKAVLEIKKDRKKWIAKSLHRAKQFSWDKCADETLAILQKVAKQGRT